MSTPFGSETQQESAQRMYDARASTYEDSWHPAYKRRFIAEAPLQPGDRVLSLCCGTGLEAFLAAAIVGDTGGVVGVDVSTGMLGQLRARQGREREVGKRIRAADHDVTRLEGLSGEGVEEGAFDAILCSCAFVLLSEPSKVLAHWREYLKPGGVMVIDVTHEHNLQAGRVLEGIAKDMGVKFPSNLSWIKSQDSFRDMLEAQGMTVEKVTVMESITGRGRYYLGVSEAESQFDFIMNSKLTTQLASDDFKARAKPLFIKAWANAAEDGKVADSDALYVFVARRPL